MVWGAGGEGAAIVALFALAAAGPRATADRWWVERYVLEGPRHVWLGVEGDDRAEAFLMGDEVVVEVRAGTIGAEDARALTTAARRARDAAKRPLPEGWIPEGDILSLGGRLDGRSVDGAWRPAAPGTEEARALVTAVERVVAALPPVAREGSVVYTRPVDAERAALLKRDGRLPFVTRAAAERLPAVAAALADTGRFVSVPAADQPALSALLAGGNQLFVEGKTTFEVKVLGIRGRS